MTLKKKVVALFAAFLSVLLLCSLAFFYRTVRSELERDNLDRMTYYGRQLARGFEEEGLAGLRKNVPQIGSWPMRVTLIAGDGSVLYDSTGTGALDNHRDRPEIRDAAKSGSGSAVRYSATLRSYMHYYAFTVYGLGGQDTFIRVAYPLSALSGILRECVRRSAYFVLGVGVVSVGFWMWLTRRLFRPLEEIARRAEQVGGNENKEGNEFPAFPIFRDAELQKLSSALNDMSVRLRDADADIRKRREELARLVEALPVGVVMIGPDRAVRYLNGVARSLFGDRGQVVKGSPVELLIPTGGIYDMLDRPDAEATVFLPSPSGAGLSIRVSTVTLAGGRLLTLRDTTEERRLEEARRNFTIDAGHELQTPLTAIRAAAELLLDDIGAEPSGSKAEDGKLLRTILRQQERMTSLIDDLLLLVKLEDGSPPEARAPEDLTEILNSVAEEYRENPAARGITFETVFDVKEKGGATARVNRPELLRALSNLVDNAVRKCAEHYGDKPGATVRLSLAPRMGEARTDADGRPWWAISVADNGPGVSPEIADRIFESFHDGDGPRRRGKWGSGGHGLGLSIAARIVRSHGGGIDLLPSESGAVFEILLPAE